MLPSANCDAVSESEGVVVEVMVVNGVASAAAVRTRREWSSRVNSYGGGGTTSAAFVVVVASGSWRLPSGESCKVDEEGALVVGVGKTTVSDGALFSRWVVLMVSIIGVGCCCCSCGTLSLSSTKEGEWPKPRDCDGTSATRDRTAVKDEG